MRKAQGHVLTVTLTLLQIGCADRVGGLKSSAVTHTPGNASGDVEVAIGFRDSIGSADTSTLFSLTPYRPGYRFRGFPAILIRVPRAALSAIRANPRIKYAAEGQPLQPLSEVNGWQTQATPYGHNILQVHNDATHGDARYGAGIGIAVVDGGIDCYGVPDFPYGCAGGHDFTDDSTFETPDPFTDSGTHGTEVTSLIFAEAANDIGIRGVAPKAFIYSLKIFSDRHDGNCLWSAAAIDYATYDLSSAVSIIQTSYASGGGLNDDTKATYTANCAPEVSAVANAVNSGRFFSAAAGNINTPPYGSDSVTFPARLPGVAAVGGLEC